MLNSAPNYLLQNRIGVDINRVELNIKQPLIQKRIGVDVNPAQLSINPLIPKLYHYRINTQGSYLALEIRNTSTTTKTCVAYGNSHLAYV